MKKFFSILLAFAMMVATANYTISKTAAQNPPEPQSVISYDFTL